MHTQHPDVHEYGLADDCPECAVAAENPWRDLDHVMLRELVDRTLRSRFGGEHLRKNGEIVGPNPYGDVLAPRSHNEARAMAVVMTQLERAGRLMEYAPGAVVTYLADRWHAPVALAEPERV